MTKTERDALARAAMPKALYRTKKSWEHMRSRCNNPKDRKYPRYGGRGIRCCERWALFANFLEDMGLRPEGLTLNRIDNDGDYCPENCEWADAFAQAGNTSQNLYVTHNGETACLREWSRRTGLRVETISKRLGAGLPSHLILEPYPGRTNAPDTSQYKGVSVDRETGKWRAMIGANGKRIYLGRFQTEIEAANAYEAAAIKYFGTAARPDAPAGEKGT